MIRSGMTCDGRFGIFLLGAGRLRFDFWESWRWVGLGGGFSDLRMMMMLLCCDLRGRWGGLVLRR